MTETTVDLTYAKTALERKQEMGLTGASTVKALEWSIAEIERLRSRVAEQHDQLLEAWAESTGLRMRLEDE